MTSLPPLSNDTVELMVKGSPLEAPHVVEVYPIEARPKHVWLCDGQRNCIAAFWLFPSPLDHAMTVRVMGYISSGSNAAQSDHPLVAIGDVKFLEALPPNRKKPPTKKYTCTQNCRIQGGKIPTFFHQFANFLTIDQLAGNQTSNNLWEEKLRVVANFFSLNQAMHTLHSHSPNASTELYMSVLKDFQESQWDRQASSLTSNAGRESAEIAEKIKTQHKAALQYALASVNSLSMAKLNVTHSFLCDGLINDAGLIRRKNVRAGTTSFCPHEEVAQKMLDAISTLSALESQVMHHQKSEQSASSVLALLIYSAATLLIILDIHPYADGNGRLARIFMNWALSVKGHCPFLIHLFATPTQRQNYMDAVKKTRRNCDVKMFGTANAETVRNLHQVSGCLFPTVDLILDRLHKAVVECNRSLTDSKTRIQENEEAKAARRFRERAAAGSCLICFEGNPNIATLCCGKAVHLNCMAQWLSSQSSCPQCRAALPSIPERIRRSRSIGAEEESDETTDYEYEITMEYDTTRSMTGQFETTTTDDDDQMENETQDYGQDTTTTDDETTSANDNGAAIEDDTTSDHAEDTTMDDTTVDETTLDDTTEDDATQHASSHLPPICSHCSNRSARDCSNCCCGRCCIIHGLYACERHCYE